MLDSQAVASGSNTGLSVGTEKGSPKMPTSILPLFISLLQASSCWVLSDGVKSKLLKK